MRPLRLAIALLALVAVYGPNARAANESRAGEFLEYEISWMEMLVGRIRVTLHGPTTKDSRDCFKIEAYARTEGVVEKLYEAKYKYFGYLLPGSQPWLFEEWEKEDDWKLHEWLEFAPAPGAASPIPQAEVLVRRYKKGKLRDEKWIDRKILDPASAIFKLLESDIAVGKHYEMDVIEGKEIYQARGYVTEGGPVQTIFGVKNSVNLVPQFYYEGKPLGERQYMVTFVRMNHPIPVFFQADIEYGSFQASLVKYKNPAGR